MHVIWRYTLSRRSPEGRRRVPQRIHSGRYDWNFGDEHGHLLFSEAKVMHPGERVELVVSHCDPTVNLFDELWIVQQEEVIGRREITLRGCCR